MIPDGKEPLTDVAPHTCINQRYSPIGGPFAQNLNFAAEFRNDAIAVGRRFVVQEVVFDHVCLVTETKDKVAMAVMTVISHDVPQNRLRSDGDHRLGYVLGVFADARPKAAAE